MNYGSEPADQVVRYSLEGAEFALRISGTAAKNFFIFAQAVLHDSKKTHGKTHLIRLLKEQKPLKFFTVDKNRMHDFARAAKTHGLLFCPIRDKMDPDHIEIAILQDDASKAIYDKHAETILGNMDSVVFLGGREASTIKEISENWLGKATISMQTDSRSRGQSESYSQNTQRLGRELMTPAELATMPGDKCILQLRGLPPFFSPKYDLKRHPNYRYTAEADKQKNAFDLDRLINRRRRPRLNEACTMYEVTVPDDALTEEDEDILNYDDIDDPDAFA